MAHLDTALHNAYEAMGPSSDAEARVLSALRAEAAHAQTAPITSPADHRRWLVALPLAACLALAAIGLSMRTPANQSVSSQLASQEAASQETTSQEAAANDALPTTSLKADEDAVDAELASEESAIATTFSPPYALVTLPSGEVLEVGEPYDGDVDDTSAVEATATTADDSVTAPCEVVDARWARFDGDPTWYTCAPQTQR